MDQGRGAALRKEDAPSVVARKPASLHEVLIPKSEKSWEERGAKPETYWYSLGHRIFDCVLVHPRVGTICLGDQSRCESCDSLE